ncbi:Toluene-4-sulfonate monooxygenase system iron-sulfur subunit TsaM1 [Sulfitobacter sp. DSM 110093]|uniref:aromatic ring-hydroxylating dioxygenase subunit alpha n=1 Tax=Sulfitobacter sp. DSM 110093 TaxID=2883127 RepID=UPI001FAD211A|nr:aromatic ring-hydroxylating dioxygenase subunit alpha [Sulfitobacter sp. DSM 110093]UOA33298.1 Toluene-4-sulfonate monooxygenase system iron-sulfur subunit TsaM1 [Sulfitobacter sp. DSM 110093]
MTSTSFPQNAWYAAGWSHDVARALKPVTICQRKLVLYRTSSGAVTAMDDACWHRLAPLSKGRIEGDNVVCPYHGLKFEPGGRCVHMPSQDTINPSACVRTYPAVERHRMIWLWLGDPALADDSTIPDLWWLTSDDWAGDGGTIHTKCDYRLVLDNLMDLTHETFVHPESIGNEAVAEAPFDVTNEGRTVKVTRWMKGIDAPAFLRAQLGKPGDVDRWQIINFTAPSTIAIDVGVALTGTGAPEGDRSQGVNLMVINIITPETDKTAHYFWCVVRNYRTQDQSATVSIRRGVREVFRQDEEILEAQQEGMDRHPDKEFYNLNIDAGGMWARRKIDAMIAEEADGPKGLPQAERANA